MSSAASSDAAAASAAPELDTQVIQVTSRSSATVTLSVNPSSSSPAASAPIVSPRHVHDDTEVVLSSPVNTESKPRPISQPSASPSNKSSGEAAAPAGESKPALLSPPLSTDDADDSDAPSMPMMSPRPLKLDASELVETEDQLNPNTPMLKCSLCFKQTSKAEKCDNPKCIFSGKPVCAHCVIVSEQTKGGKKKCLCASCYAEKAQDKKGCQCVVQ